MIRIFILAAMTTLALNVAGADGTNVTTSVSTNSAAPIRIGTADADKHIDESAIVTGKVAQVTFRPKVVFLNIDEAFPDSPFTVVIMSKNTNDFGDIQALEGKSIEVSGKIKSFKDKPEIVIDSTNQLTVLTAKAEEPAKK
ncbi:MAG TPA: hypothetical protein VG347_05745 [Verrucomicrobiae bacterium]|nr:hypothetical protein [Verrucomicrobiae bacterium]